MHIITDIITMMSGERVKVKTKSYQNDMVTFKNKDDVLTALDVYKRQEGVFLLCNILDLLIYS